jgi:N-acylneuraminate cytidylyltransferase
MERANSIAIIPARGGSKRIPKKNVKDFLGKPIISYSIQAALESKIFSEVMVSTDDEEIAGIAKNYGANVPFYRSKELSGDMAMTAPVLLEVLSEYKKRGEHFDIACCIYPCTPFITPQKLEHGINLLQQSKADFVFPVVKFSYPPQRCLVIREQKIAMLYPENCSKRSQDLEPVYHDAGQFYFAKTEQLEKEQTIFGKNTVPLIYAESEVQDIDTMEDWKMAEMKFMFNRNIAMNQIFPAI